MSYIFLCEITFPIESDWTNKFNSSFRVSLGQLFLQNVKYETSPNKMKE